MSKERHELTEQDIRDATRVAQPYCLSNNEAGWIRAAIRQALRKNVRGHRRLKSKFGAKFDPTHMNTQREFLEGLYRTLGGDPTHITNTENGNES